MISDKSRTIDHLRGDLFATSADFILDSVGFFGGRTWTRTRDLLHVRQAL